MAANMHIQCWKRIILKTELQITSFCQRFMEILYCVETPPISRNRRLLVSQHTANFRFQCQSISIYYIEFATQAWISRSPLADDVVWLHWNIRELNVSVENQFKILYACLLPTHLNLWIHSQNHIMFNVWLQDNRCLTWSKCRKVLVYRSKLKLYSLDIFRFLSGILFTLTVVMWCF